MVPKSDYWTELSERNLQIQTPGPDAEESQLVGLYFYLFVYLVEVKFYVI